MRDREPRAVVVAEHHVRLDPDADHGERHPEDLDGLADRVHPGEEGLRHRLVDHRHVGARGVLHLGEAPPRHEGPAGHLHPGGGEPPDPRPGELGAPVGHRSAGGFLPRHLPHRRELAQQLRLLHREPGPAAPGAGLVGAVGDVDPALEEAEDEEGLRPHGLELGGHRPVDAGDGRRHPHHHHHADGDAEDGEGRPHLAGPDRVEGDADALGGACDGGEHAAHSARRATIGSRRAARLAG